MKVLQPTFVLFFQTKLQLTLSLLEQCYPPFPDCKGLPGPKQYYRHALVLLIPWHCPIEHAWDELGP